MAHSSGRLAGKTALVTGGARGIGEGIVRRFIEEGASVAIVDADEGRGDALALELGCSFLPLDVRQSEQWERVVASLRERFGRLDILVNNAGIGWAGSIEDETVEQHRRILDVNVSGVWLGIRTAIPLLAASGAASVVNISSIDGLVGAGGVTTYAASKFAVTGLTRSLALELGPRRIRVNSVHPGIIDTPLLRSGGEKTLARLGKALEHQPIPRLGTPEDVANAVLFFASDESAYCTGASLTVDGGHIAGPIREAPEG